MPDRPEFSEPGYRGCPPSIWLVGLSGSGKSTVGPILARRLEFEFVDLDSRIEELAGASIPSIFKNGGQGKFRALEASAADGLAAEVRTVVATGGGWMARRDIDRNSHGRLRVWLRVSPETAMNRIGEGGGTRPLLAGGNVRKRLTNLLESRAEGYAEAEFHVDTDSRGPEQVAGAILRELVRAGWSVNRQRARN